jgi:hypothetical protein
LPKNRTDPDFPDWYSDLFRRRYRFSISYIAASSDPPNWEILSKIAAEGLLDRIAVNTLLSIRHLGRYLTAAWLAVRMRPFSVMALAQTAFVRRVQAWHLRR